MATLNIKNLPDSLYRKLQSRARREHRSVAQQVIVMLAGQLESPKPLSILDLQDLGKDVWAGIDPAEHVRGERESWD